MAGSGEGAVALIMTDFDALIAEAEAAGTREALRRFGSATLRVRGETRRGCCVHLVVECEGAAVARWRYELNGTIVEDHHTGAWQLAFDEYGTRQTAHRCALPALAPKERGDSHGLGGSA